MKNYILLRLWKKSGEGFGVYKDEKRLAYALIINEQHIIEKPVIQKRFFVFHSLLFFLQDRLHHSKVLFPTCDGELYGFSISHFQDVDARIQLGKKLYELLFSPKLHPYFYHFISETEPSGSRYDYEQYRNSLLKRKTPMLRMVYPVIAHQPTITDQWDIGCKQKSKWFQEPDMPRHLQPII